MIFNNNSNIYNIKIFHNKIVELLGYIYKNLEDHFMAERPVNFADSDNWVLHFELLPRVR